MLLGSGTRGRSAVELARELIKEFGSLRELLSADRHAGAAKLGIGPARYAALQAALELARRHFRGAACATGSALNAPEATRRFLVAQLRDRPYEVFCGLYLDTATRLIAFEEISAGRSTAPACTPGRSCGRRCVHNAAAVIVAHNHPSGARRAQPGGRVVTRRLRDALALVDVRVLDHLIVGDGRCYSFAEHGLL